MRRLNQGSFVLPCFVLFAFWVVFSLCSVLASVFDLSTGAYFWAYTDVNGTVWSDCADVPLRNCSLTQCDEAIVMYKLQCSLWDVWCDPLRDDAALSLCRCIEIPAGSSSHTVIRLTGKGIPHSHSSRRGDHYIHLKIKVPTWVPISSLSSCLSTGCQEGCWVQCGHPPGIIREFKSCQGNVFLLGFENYHHGSNVSPHLVTTKHQNSLKQF